MRTELLVDFLSREIATVRDSPAVLMVFHQIPKLVWLGGTLVVIQAMGIS